VPPVGEGDSAGFLQQAELRQLFAGAVLIASIKRFSETSPEWTSRNPAASIVSSPTAPSAASAKG
jgi:hypothetical protein